MCVCLAGTGPGKGCGLAACAKTAKCHSSYAVVLACYLSKVLVTLVRHRLMPPEVLFCPDVVGVWPAMAVPRPLVAKQKKG
jgi:hypothetical protein